MMREREVGQAKEQSFEQKILEGEVIFQTQTSLREVVKHKGSDPVGLLDASAILEAKDLGRSILYIVSFPPNQSSLGGERLIKVLTGAKPVRQTRTQDKPAIIADWIILQEQERKRDLRYKGLYDDHVAPNSFVRQQIEEFGANHFPQFWQAIRSTYHDDTNTMLHGLFKRLISEEKAQARFGLDFLISDQERFLRVINSVWEYKTSFAELLSKKFGISDDASIIFHDKGSQLFVLMMQKTSEIQELIRDFYNQLDDTAKRRLLYSVISLYNFPVSEGTILVDEDGNLHNMYDGRLMSSPDRFGIRKLTNCQVEITDEEAYVKALFEKDERTGYREPRIVEKYIPPQQEEIVPEILWERDKTSGRAEYFCGRISQELIDALPHLFSKNHDTLSGKLVVAAYSYDLRRNLPAKLALRRGGIKQDIKEAQVPASVSIYDNLFLKASPVILGLEALVKGSVDN